MSEKSWTVVVVRTVVTVAAVNVAGENAEEAEAAALDLARRDGFDALVDWQHATDSTVATDVVDRGALAARLRAQVERFNG